MNFYVHVSVTPNKMEKINHRNKLYQYTNVESEHRDLRAKNGEKSSKNYKIIYTDIHSTPATKSISKHVQGFCVIINILYTANKAIKYWAINKNNIGAVGSISTLQLKRFWYDLEPGSVCLF